MAQHQRLTGPTGQNNAATFSPEMVQGWKPEQPRLFSSRNRQGLTISQTTHVQAPFSEEMAEGWYPDEPVLTRGKIGFAWFDIAVPSMTVEMWEGEMPSRPRIQLGPRIGLPISQTTHTPTAFSQDMAEGSIPDQPRLPFRPKFGWQDAQLTFQVQMTAEMFAGSHPDTSRAWIAPRIPLPISQPTHTAAPFNQDMVEGEMPSRPRPHVLGKNGWSADQLTFIVQMTPEMFKGNIPDKNRERLGPKIPLPIAQTTHVPAPFGHEMVQGQKPDRGFRFERKPGWQANVVDSIATVFNVIADWLVRMLADDTVMQASADDHVVYVPAETVTELGASDVIVRVPPDRTVRLQ